MHPATYREMENAWRRREVRSGRLSEKDLPASDLAARTALEQKAVHANLQLFIMRNFARPAAAAVVA